MTYRTHPDVVDALQNANDWVEREGGSPLPAAVAREIVKTSFSGRAPYRIAALSLLLGGLELNVDNIAWLVRDREIGFPNEPTFKFVKDRL